MRIGLLIDYGEDEIQFVKEAGFGSVELRIPPESALDPAVCGNEGLKAARDHLGEMDIEISSIGHYTNNLDPDPEVRRTNAAYLERLMDAAPVLGVDVVCTFAGRDPEVDIPDNIPAFKEVYTPLARKAEDMGLRLAFENCPMFHTFPFRGINIAYTPRAWDLMFDAVDSKALGLEYDPSHPVCLLMDEIELIYRYGERIYHVHAKDAEVVWRNVELNGILEPGAVRHRTPGLGQVDWAKFVSALTEVGYAGNLDIEGRHDPVYRDERENEGLLIAKRTLEQFVG